MKFLLGAFIMTFLNSLFLLVSDAGWIAITSISASFFSLVGLVVVALINKKVNTVKESIDGLLEEKSKADKALGAKEEKDVREKQDASENVGKLKVYQEVKEIKQEIVKAVEETADETHKKVEEVPDEVVKKLPPK